MMEIWTFNQGEAEQLFNRACQQKNWPEAARMCRLGMAYHDHQEDVALLHEDYDHANRAGLFRQEWLNCLDTIWAES